jgi:hypothetical protein
MMQECAIVDIDGVLADNTARLHHIIDKETGKKPEDGANWKAYGEGILTDAPYKATINTIARTPYVKVLLTGRHEGERAPTLEWLFAYAVPLGLNWKELYMRPTKDYRSSVDMKRWALEELILPKYNPVIAFEDHPGVVRMYAEYGIPSMVPNNQYVQGWEVWGDA